MADKQKLAIVAWIILIPATIWLTLSSQNILIYSAGLSLIVINFIDSPNTRQLPYATRQARKLYKPLQRKLTLTPALIYILDNTSYDPIIITIITLFLIEIVTSGMKEYLTRKPPEKHHALTSHLTLAFTLAILVAIAMPPTSQNPIVKTVITFGFIAFAVEPEYNAIERLLHKTIDQTRIKDSKDET